MGAVHVRRPFISAGCRNGTLDDQILIGPYWAVYLAPERGREFIREQKRKPCADCGVEYPYYVMDFDHRDPNEKSFTIATYGYRVSEVKLLAELAKCDVVCANCHRERSFKITST